MIADSGMSEAQYLVAVDEALQMMNNGEGGGGGSSDGPTYQETHHQENSHGNSQENSQGTGTLRKVVYAARKTVTLQCVVSDPAAVLLAVAMANRADEGKRYTLFLAPNGYDDEVQHASVLLNTHCQHLITLSL